MQINIYPSEQEAGRRAAQKGADAIDAAIKARGEASVILATGASQFEVLDALVEMPGIDWSCVTVFHLSIPISKPTCVQIIHRYRHIYIDMNRQSL